MDRYGRGRWTSPLLAAAAVAFLSGCAAATSAGPRFYGATAESHRPIAIEVNNVGWADVVVYSVSGSARIRLGVANSNQRTRFKLPRAHEFAPDLRLQADPIGSSHTYDSEPLSPAPGQVVHWTIHESRGLRSLMVY